MDYFTYCEDEAIKVKVEGMPVHAFFAPEGFLEWGLGTMRGEANLRNQIVDMPIDEFLGLAEPIPEDDEKRHAPMSEFRKDVLSGKKTDWEIPYLSITENEDGIWKVVGHDGRHRGKLLQSLGYETMPVRISIPKDSGAFLDESALPDILWCQNDRSVERERDYYPFPITEDNFNEPYCKIEGDAITVGPVQRPVVVATDEYAGKAPTECLVARKNFKKNYVPNVAYRKDNVMPARNLKEYLQKRGQAKFYV